MKTNLSIAGLLGTKAEADELKFISNVFLVGIRIKKLVKEQKDNQENIK